MKLLQTEIEFEIGQEVYFQLGGEDSKGLITAIIIRGEDQAIEYEVVWKNRYKDWHTSTELTTSNTSVL